MEEMIKVAVKFYGGLEKYASEKQGQQQIMMRKGASVLDLLAHLGLPPTLATLVFTNEEILSLEAVLPDNASIKIFPPVAGG